MSSNIRHVINLVGFICLFTATFGHAQYLDDSLPKADSYGKRLTIRRGISYGEERHQFLDAYLPTPAFRAPAVVCWFGGAFQNGAITQLENLAGFLANRGFVAITPNYFLGAPDGRWAAWPNAVYDAKSAVRYVRAHATELNVDPIKSLRWVTARARISR